MKIARMRWFPFRVPLTAAFVTAAGPQPQTAREGVMLEITTDAGAVGWGEATPLPERGGGTAGNVHTLLRSAAGLLIGQDETAALALLDRNHDADGYAATRCALDIALVDAAARLEGVRVADHLEPGEDRPPDRVPVNALIGLPTLVEAARAAVAAREAGFDVVKLKVGHAPTREDERQRVAAVRQALGPTIALRLDANGAWIGQEAIESVRALEPYDIDLIEQPVPAADLNDLRHVQDATRIDIAADESVQDVEALRQILHRHAARAIVIKPMILGGLRPAAEAARLARAAGLRVIVTGTIDAGIATTAALHLAAATAPAEAAGIATAPLLASDLLRDSLTVESGWMTVPAGAGLGVMVDEAMVEEYRLGPTEEAY